MLYFNTVEFGGNMGGTIGLSLFQELCEGDTKDVSFFL